MDISIVFATYKRGDILKFTLDSLVKIDAGFLTYEIIIVDNSLDQRDESLVRSYEGKMPVYYFSEKSPGKNSALVTGLKNATGKLLVFTDDDVIVERDWLIQLWDGVQRHPDASIYGGRILPSYPAGYEKLSEKIDFDNWFLRSAFVIADWEQDEGSIKAGHIWGPNMAVKRDVFESGLTFNTTIGPNGKDYVMGSETEFIKRAYAQGFKGVYLPLALVYHQIRLDQLSMDWIKGRAFRSGKGQACLSPKSELKRYFGVPRYLIKKYIVKKMALLASPFMSKERAFALTVELYMLKGQITQYRIMNYE